MNTKNLIFIAILALDTSTTKAQIAKWAIRPDYSSLQFDAENELVIGQKDSKTSIWNGKGNLLSTTNDVLYSFRENKAVTVKPNTSNITGFYSIKGDFIKVDLCNVTCDYPYFSDRYLLVKQGDYFQFIDSDGKKGAERYFMAFPYNAELAACYTFEDLEKKRNPMCYYITTKKEKVALSLNGKPIDAEDVDFLSSLTDEGIGVLSTKHKFYYYNNSTKEISPLFEKDDEKDKKKQASMAGELSENLRKEGDSLFVVTAKVGKVGKAEIYMDKCYVPIKISFSENGVETSARVFKRDKHDIPTYTTLLTKTKSVENGKWMISYRGKPIVSNIFDNVRPIKDDLAFVCKDGKWGMIDVADENNFQFRINGGKPVGFRHSAYETSIRMDLPVFIPSGKTSFEVVEDEKFHIDGTSIVRKDTENGNYVQYNCAIDIPPTLLDTIAEIGCNVQVHYDGLVSPKIPITFSAWHVKRFNVDIIEQSGVSNGEFSFTINIDEQKAIDETDYPFEVKISTDSIVAYADKLSETRYKITLSSLAEGVNEFSVNILESGCPPQNFPFEVTYTKSVAKSRNEKAVSAKAEVRKKQVRSTPKQVNTPYIPI